MGEANGEKGPRHEYKKEDFIIRVHRKISEALVTLIYPVSFITPNIISWFGFALTLLSSLFLAIAVSNANYLIVAAVLYWLSAILDCVDGQLARKREETSFRGEWLESILEIMKGTAFWIAVGFNITTTKSVILGFDVWFLITVVISFINILTFMSIYASWLFQESQPVSHGHVYIAMGIMVFNLLEIALVICTILAILAIIYTLFEKSLLPQNVTHSKKRLKVDY